MSNAFGKLSFKAYTDEKFTKELPDGEYTVKINPSEFNRSLSVNVKSTDSIRKDNDTGEDGGLASEKYSFDLMFDNTGVLGWKYEKGLKEELKKFLLIVYAREDSTTQKKTANYLEMTYCGETFKCKMTSLSIKYTLFNSEGDPLRAKLSCSFTSVDVLKEDGNKDTSKKKGKKKPKPIPPQTSNKECCECCPSFNETTTTAKENNSVSLMSVNYTPAN